MNSSDNRISHSESVSSTIELHVIDNHLTDDVSTPVTTTETANGLKLSSDNSSLSLSQSLSSSSSDQLPVPPLYKCIHFCCDPLHRIGQILLILILQIFTLWQKACILYSKSTIFITLIICILTSLGHLRRFISDPINDPIESSIAFERTRPRPPFMDSFIEWIYESETNYNKAFDEKFLETEPATCVLYDLRAPNANILTLKYLKSLEKILSYAQNTIVYHNGKNISYQDVCERKYRMDSLKIFSNQMIINNNVSNPCISIPSPLNAFEVIDGDLSYIASLPNITIQNLAIINAIEHTISSGALLGSPKIGFFEKYPIPYLSSSSAATTNKLSSMSNDINSNILAGVVSSSSFLVIFPLLSSSSAVTSVTLWKPSALKSLYLIEDGDILWRGHCMEKSADVLVHDAEMISRFEYILPSVIGTTFLIFLMVSSQHRIGSLTIKTTSCLYHRPWLFHLFHTWILTIVICISGFLTLFSSMGIYAGFRYFLFHMWSPFFLFGLYLFVICVTFFVISSYNQIRFFNVSSDTDIVISNMSRVFRRSARVTMPILLVFFTSSAALAISAMIEGLKRMWLACIILVPYAYIILMSLLISLMTLHYRWLSNALINQTAKSSAASSAASAASAANKGMDKNHPTDMIWAKSVHHGFSASVSSFEHISPKKIDLNKRNNDTPSSSSTTTTKPISSSLMTLAVPENEEVDTINNTNTLSSAPSAPTSRVSVSYDLSDDLTRYTPLERCIHRYATIIRSTKYKRYLLISSIILFIFCLIFIIIFAIISVKQRLSPMIEHIILPDDDTQNYIRSVDNNFPYLFSAAPGYLVITNDQIYSSFSSSSSSSSYMAVTTKEQDFFHNIPNILRSTSDYVLPAFPIISWFEDFRLWFILHHTTDLIDKYGNNFTQNNAQIWTNNNNSSSSSNITAFDGAYAPPNLFYSWLIEEWLPDNLNYANDLRFKCGNIPLTSILSWSSSSSSSSSSISNLCARSQILLWMSRITFYFKPIGFQLYEQSTGYIDRFKDFDSMITTASQQSQSNLETRTSLRLSLMMNYFANVVLLYKTPIAATILSKLLLAIALTLRTIFAAPSRPRPWQWIFLLMTIGQSIAVSVLSAAVIRSLGLYSITFFVDLSRNILEALSCLGILQVSRMWNILPSTFPSWYRLRHSLVLVAPASLYASAAMIWFLLGLTMAEPQFYGWLLLLTCVVSIQFVTLIIALLYLPTVVLFLSSTVEKWDRNPCWGWNINKSQHKQND